MSTPDPVPPAPAAPWYTSPVQIAQVSAAVSAVIAVYPKLGQVLGWVTPTDVTNGVSAVFGVIGIVAGVVGIIKRKNSKLQPLTLTKSGAENHPATVAAEAVKNSSTTI